MKASGMKLGALVVLIAILVSAVAVVGAQTTADTSSTTTADMRPDRGFGFGRGEMLTLIAEQLGITADELVTELQAGKTVADLATEKDVDVNTIIDAIVAAHSETLTAAVTAGTLTQAQADAHIALLKANLEARFSQAWTAGNGPGMMGRGGHGGMGGMMAPDGMGGMGRGGRGGHGGMMGPNGMGGMWNNNGTQPTDPAVTPEATVVPNS